MTIAHVEGRELFEARRATVRENLHKHGDAFRADVRTASSLRFIRPTTAATAATATTAKDAGPFLAQRKLNEVIPPALDEKIGAVKKSKFPDKLIELDVSGVDLTWMRELASFDHWAFELSEERPVSYYQLEVPELSRIARVRLLQGLKSKDIAGAARDVEHLARLAATSEHWNVVLASISMMQASRDAFEHARAEGLFDPGAPGVDEWAPPSRASLDAAWRAVRAYMGVLNFYVDPAQLGDLLTAPDLHAGRCAALNDAAIMYITVAPMSGDDYELCREWITKALEDTKARSECRLTLAREAWGNDEQRSLVVGTDAFCNPEEEGPACVFAAFFSAFPGIRDVLTDANIMPVSGLFEYR